MIRRILNTAMLLVLFSGTLACTSKEEKALEIYSIAEFEEQQNNPAHASRLYRKIIRDFPDTDTAEKAATRLGVIDP